jgi:hypothetical protein
MEENDGVEGERNTTPLMERVQVRRRRSEKCASEEESSEGEEAPEKAQELSNSQIDSEDLRT